MDKVGCGLGREVNPTAGRYQVQAASRGVSGQCDKDDHTSQSQQGTDQQCAFCAGKSVVPASGPDGDCRRVGQG